MNMIISIMDFLKITKKKIIVTVLFPLMALSILLLGFILDEIVRLGPNDISTNVIYSFLDYFYIFIFLPLSFVDIDFSPSVIFKIAIILTPIWWYFLSCVIYFLKKF